MQINPVQINPAVPGKLTRIAVGNVGAPVISADGNTIVYTQWNDDNHWDVMSYRDGDTQRLSDGQHSCTDAAVSGSGDVVAWSRYSKLDPSDRTGNYDVVQSRGGVVSDLAATKADEMSPAISGDGHTTVWIYDDPSKPIGFDIQENKDGQTSFLTTDWPVDTDPMVNNDGSRVFFRRKIQYDDGDLWMRDESGVLKQLTNTPWGEWNAVMDADGKTLSWSEDISGNHQLFRYEVDHRVKTVVAAEDGVDEMESTLSADGTKMAYVREDRKNKQAPQIMLVENGQTVPLTTDGWNSWPKMSADGRVMTWVAVEPDQQTQSIYRFERDAATPEPTPTPGGGS